MNTDILPPLHRHVSLVRLLEELETVEAERTKLGERLQKLSSSQSDAHAITLRQEQEQKSALIAQVSAQADRFERLVTQARDLTGVINTKHSATLLDLTSTVAALPASASPAAVAADELDSKHTDAVATELDEKTTGPPSGSVAPAAGSVILWKLFMMGVCLTVGTHCIL